MDQEGLFKSKQLIPLVKSTNEILYFMGWNRTFTDMQQKKCSICGANLKKTDLLVKIKECGHIFHAECAIERHSVSI